MKTNKELILEYMNDKGYTIPPKNIAYEHRQSGETYLNSSGNEMNPQPIGIYFVSEILDFSFFVFDKSMKVITSDGLVLAFIRKGKIYDNTPKK